MRIQSIRPATDKEGRLTVAMVVFGRRAEDIEQFIEQLEGTGAFRNVVTRAETTTPQGLLEVTLEGRYAGAARAGEGGLTCCGESCASTACPCWCCSWRSW